MHRFDTSVRTALVLNRVSLISIHFISKLLLLVGRAFLHFCTVVLSLLDADLLAGYARTHLARAPQRLAQVCKVNLVWVQARSRSKQRDCLFGPPYLLQQGVSVCGMTALRVARTAHNIYVCMLLRKSSFRLGVGLQQIWTDEERALMLRLVESNALKIRGVRA